MLILKQQQTETYNEGGENNTVQDLNYQLRHSDASSLDDLLGCGVECIDSSHDGGRDEGYSITQGDWQVMPNFKFHIMHLH